MKEPVLLSDRPDGQGLVVSMVVPAAFGALTGWVLGVSEIGYLILSFLGIAGAFLAGLEHDYPIDGVYRGMLAGLLFGAGILITHGLIDTEAKAELPHPEALLLVITAGFAAVFGWLGARRRSRLSGASRGTD